MVDSIVYYKPETSVATYGYQSFNGVVIPTYTPADNLSAYIKVKEGE